MLWVKSTTSVLNQALSWQGMPALDPKILLLQLGLLP